MQCSCTCRFASAKDTTIHSERQVHSREALRSSESRVVKQRGGKVSSRASLSARTTLTLPWLSPLLHICCIASLEQQNIRGGSCQLHKFISELKRVIMCIPVSHRYMLFPCSSQSIRSLAYIPSPPGKAVIIVEFATTHIHSRHSLP